MLRGRDQNRLSVRHPRRLAVDLEIAQCKFARLAAALGDNRKSRANRECQPLAIRRPRERLRRTRQFGDLTGAPRPAHPDLRRPAAVGNPGQSRVLRPARRAVAPRPFRNPPRRAARQRHLPEVGKRAVRDPIVPRLHVDRVRAIGIDSRPRDLTPRPPILQTQRRTRRAPGNCRNEERNGGDSHGRK